MFLQNFILKALNSHYRDFSQADADCFPPHEFNPTEAEQLLALCREIARDGYDPLVPRLGEKAFCDLLDTAAGYCTFVQARIGAAYLGIVVFAQAFMDCYAAPGYLQEMMRADVYRHADEAVRNHTALLLCLACFHDAEGKTEDGQNAAVGYLTRLPEMDLPMALTTLGVDDVFPFD